MTQKQQITVEIAPADQGYLNSCARLRNNEPAELVQRLVDMILRDQMILAVLDDDSKPTTRPQRLPTASPLRKPVRAAGDERPTHHDRAKSISSEDRKGMILQKALIAGKVCVPDFGSGPPMSKWYPVFKMLVADNRLIPLPLRPGEKCTHYALAEGVREELVAAKHSQTTIAPQSENVV